ncbi:MAG: hypothetical protein JNL28_03485 [Planctomycetes bacterium]|nr:hypothetical protein [Planctomycetota bacterium]
MKDASLTLTIGQRVALVAACVLFVLAIVVRGIPSRAAVAPEDVIEEGPRIVEPMQFLGAGARLRAGELDQWVDPARRTRFKALRELVFHLDGCPDLVKWIDSIDGQRLEQMISELRTGRREEALASLVLIYQLARATEWKPGLMTRTPQAQSERLGGLLQEWLRVRGEKAAKDALLAEPAVATTLLYAHVMRTAENAPVIGTLSATQDRARTFLTDLLGAGQSKRSALGELVQARHGNALAKFLGRSDPLGGFAADARTLFPDMKGTCSP